MGLFDGLLQNESFKKVAFGQLRGLIKSENLGMIVVRLDADGDLMIDMYKPGEAIVTVVTPDDIPTALPGSELPTENTLLISENIQNANSENS